MAPKQAGGPVRRQTASPAETDPARVVDILEPLVTPERARRMRDVLATRTRHVAFVFERMIDPHNLSAALRSLDAFSFQKVHLVHPGERLYGEEGEEATSKADGSKNGANAGREPTEQGSSREAGSGRRHGLSRGITIGADKWLSVEVARDTPACFATLRAQGYRILASHLGHGVPAIPLQEVDLAQPTALVFGNEHLGVSDEVLADADACFRIPMGGFAQSLNLSVAVAVSAWQARRELARLARVGNNGEDIAEGGGSATDNLGRFALTPEEQTALLAHWLRGTVRNAEGILAGSMPG